VQRSSVERPLFAEAAPNVLEQDPARGKGGEGVDIRVILDRGQ
jgi:hypothetical protein